MAAKKKIKAVVKIQIPAGKATAGPPIGSSLGPHGINIGQFVKDFNTQTANQDGMVIPVIMTIYEDRSFEFVTKTPPVANLILKELNLSKGSGVPNKTKVGKLTLAQVEKIAKIKMPDLNSTSLEAAMSMVKGTARSMGITIVE